MYAAVFSRAGQFGDLFIKGADAIEHPLSTARIYADKQFDFGVALKLLKSGYRVFRSGWNGTDMYVFYQKGFPDGTPIKGEVAVATDIEVGTVCKFLPYLMVKTAGVEAQFVPWNPSQADVLADDWRVSW